MKKNSEYNGVKFKNITINSCNVKKGDLFVAIKGAAKDGHEFVEDAVKNGASICLVQADCWTDKPLKIGESPIVLVKDTHDELSHLAYEYFEQPAMRMKIIGITGTNGKTTIGFLMDKILSDLGYRTGLIGTVIYKINDKVIEADRTTPDALDLNRYLGEMADYNTDYAIMEVSSHSIEQRRVGHIFYDTAIFTNLTPEHLDYHKTMDAYFNAKAKMFDNLKKDGCAIINNDDPMAEDLKRRIKGKVLTYGIDKISDLTAVNIKYSINGTKFDVMVKNRKVKIETNLIGKHNISNLLAGIAVCYINDLDLNDVKKSIKTFTAPHGRLEPVNAGQNFKVYVDYAHTEDALEKVLIALKPYVTSKLITVFGCGGDRDKLKRPKMGKVVMALSDFAIITSDNPRSENPMDIIRQIENGIDDEKKSMYKVIADRRDAIKEALTMAKKDDIILIAGKGHETYQIIGKNKIHFDDREITRELLGER